jgi:hypothetical protein
MTVEQLNFFFLKVKLLKSSSSPKINWIRAIDKKKYYCSNGVEQIFRAIAIRADDHDPNIDLSIIVFVFMLHLTKAVIM